MAFGEGIMFAVENMTLGNSVLKSMIGTGCSNSDSDESVC